MGKLLESRLEYDEYNRTRVTMAGCVCLESLKYDDKIASVS